MPYKHTHKKIPKELDRRVKVSEDDRILIKKLHTEGNSQRALAREFKISRRLVTFIVYPDRYEHAKEQRAQRGKDGRYYCKETHTEAIRKHRKYKQVLYLQGVLEESRDGEKEKI